jgi:O-antigen/teichoic acid export membrane protein
MNKITKSLLSNGVGLIITMLDRVLVIPVLSHFCTPTHLSSWLLLRTIPGYLVSADLGVSSHAGNQMTSHLGSHKELAASIVSTNTKAIVWSSTVFILLATTAWIYFHGASWFSAISTISTFEASAALFLLAGYACAISHTQHLNAIFRALHLDHKGILFANGIRVFEIFLFLTTTITSQSILLGAASYIAARLIGNFFLCHHTYKLAPWARPQFRLFNKKIALQQIRPSLGFLSFPIVLALSQQVPIALIFSYEGLIVGGSFVAMHTIARLSAQIGIALNRSLWPSLAHIQSQTNSDSKNPAEFWRLSDTSTGICILVNLFVSGILIAITPLLFSLWTNNVLTLNIVVLVVLLSASFVNSVFYVMSTSLMARSKHEGIALISISVLVATILLQNVFGYAKMENLLLLLPITSLTGELILLLSVIYVISKERRIGSLAYLSGTIRAGVLGTIGRLRGKAQ